MRIYILFVLIALISCKNKSTNIRSNHNVMGCEREMKEDVYIEYNDKHVEFSTKVIKLNEKGFSKNKGILTLLGAAGIFMMIRPWDIQAGNSASGAFFSIAAAVELISTTNIFLFLISIS